MPALSEVVEAFDTLYDPAWAEPWDAVGLVCGDPSADVRRVLFAVDPVQPVIDEALESGAQLLVVHHPLFLRPVTGVAATSPKGRVVHRLIAAGCALLTAHTNADAARDGVSDALAAVLGLAGLGPLDVRPEQALDKVVTFVPLDHKDALIDALTAAGAGSIGAYERCAWTVPGTGTFRPLDGADPAIGSVGAVTEVAEARVEMVLARARRADVVAALRAAHPYEEPAFDVYELAPETSPRGIGRVGTLERPEPLAHFAERVARSLPATAAGVRVAGDPHRPVRTVAVCGGSGDGLIAAARAAGADAYVTADLRHHPASEAMGDSGGAAGEGSGGMALIDVSHWASEWPWLSVAADRLGTALAARGTTVESRVSRTCTDPWSWHVRSPALDSDPSTPIHTTGS